MSAFIASTKEWLNVEVFTFTTEKEDAGLS